MTNMANIPTTLALPQPINLHTTREITGFGNIGGGGVPIHTGGFGIATADTGTPQFPQNRATSTLRKPHREQIGISALQEFAKISLQPMARSCPCPSAWPLLPGAPSFRDLCGRLGTTNLNQTPCVRARLQSCRKSPIKPRASAPERRNETHCFQILPDLY